MQASTESSQGWVFLFILGVHCKQVPLADGDRSVSEPQSRLWLSLPASGSLADCTLTQPRNLSRV